MHSQRATKIVEAAITYDLIECNGDRSNYKPLIATERLHALMIEVGVQFALAIDAAMNDEDDENDEDDCQDDKDGVDEDE